MYVVKRTIVCIIWYYKRIEKNIDTLQEMYDLGKNDTIKLLDKIRMKGW